MRSSATLLSLAVLGGVLGVACGPAGPVVEVTLHNLPVNTKRIEVLAIIGGMKAREKGSFDVRTEHLSVQLPPGLQGLLQLDVNAFADSCLLASGQGTIELMGQSRLRMTVDLVPRSGCRSGPGSWRIVPFPVSHHLNAVWAYSRDEVWIAGENDTLFSLDGNGSAGLLQLLQPLKGLVGGTLHGRSLGGNESQRLVLVNREGNSMFQSVVFLDSPSKRCLYLDTETLHAAALRSPPDRVWTVGKGGTIRSWLLDKCQSEMGGNLAMVVPESVTQIDISSLNLYAVAAIPHTNSAVAVGEGGNLILINESNTVRFIARTMVSLRGVWSLTSNDIWAVGDNFTVLSFDREMGFNNNMMLNLDLRKILQQQEGLSNVALQAVWGVAQPWHLFIVGTRGTILHGTRSGNGSIQWAKEEAPTRNNLRAVSGTDPNNVWIVGEGGVVLTNRP